MLLIFFMMLTMPCHFAVRGCSVFIRNCLAVVHNFDMNLTESCRITQLRADTVRYGGCLCGRWCLSIQSLAQLKLMSF